MSVHKFHLALTRRAQEDLSQILAFTRINWGESQRIIYKNKIEKAFQAITKPPTIGKQKSKHRVYHVERHRIFYRIEDTQIKVLRILHERMEAGRHLAE